MLPKVDGRPKVSPLGFFGTIRLFLPNTFFMFPVQKKSCFRDSWKTLSGNFRYCVLIEKVYNSCSLNIFER